MNTEIYNDFYNAIKQLILENNNEYDILSHNILLIDLNNRQFFITNKKQKDAFNFQVYKFKLYSNNLYDDLNRFKQSCSDNKTYLDIFVDIEKIFITNNNTYKVINNAIYDIDDNLIFLVKNSFIDRQVNKIMPYVFLFVQNVNIKNNVLSVNELKEYSMDSQCCSKNITIEKLSSLEKYSFCSLPFLETITFSENCTISSIPEYSFDSCDNLRNVIINSPIKRIKKCAFFECYNLSSVSFPSSLETLEEKSFKSCYNLLSIELPKDFKSFIGNPFDDCSSMNLIKIKNDSDVVDINDFLNENKNYELKILVKKNILQEYLNANSSNHNNKYYYYEY